MKKIILGTIALSMCVCLTACGNSQSDATLTKLGNQLDETANTISNVQTVNPSDISMSKEVLAKISTSENPLKINQSSRIAQSSLLNEQFYKSEILDTTTRLKNNLSKDLKLSKIQISAIKDLTESLGKYTNSVSYSTNEMESTAKAINSLKKSADKDAVKLNAKLNLLACNSNARTAYFENLITTLNELENELCPDCNESSTPYLINQNPNTAYEGFYIYVRTPYDNSLQVETPNNSQEETNQENNNFSIKNIDTYNSDTTNKDCKECNDCADCPNCDKCNDTNNKTTQALPRNTDTYGPMLRNVDTFYPDNLYGRNYYGYGNNGYLGGYANNGYFGNGYANGYGYPAFYGNKRYYGQGFMPHSSNDMNRATNLPPYTYVNAEVDDKVEKFADATKNNGNNETLQENTITKTKQSFENKAQKIAKTRQSTQTTLANTPKTLEYIYERDGKNDNNQIEISEDISLNKNESNNDLSPQNNKENDSVQTFSNKIQSASSIKRDSKIEAKRNTSLQDEEDQVVVAHNLLANL